MEAIRRVCVFKYGHRFFLPPGQMLFIQSPMSVPAPSSRLSRSFSLHALPFARRSTDGLGPVSRLCIVNDFLQLPARPLPHIPPDII